MIKLSPCMIMSKLKYFNNKLNFCMNYKKTSFHTNQDNSSSNRLEYLLALVEFKIKWVEQNSTQFIQWAAPQYSFLQLCTKEFWWIPILCREETLGILLDWSSAACIWFTNHNYLVFMEKIMIKWQENILFMI